MSCLKEFLEKHFQTMDIIVGNMCCTCNKIIVKIEHAIKINKNHCNCFYDPKLISKYDYNNLSRLNRVLQNNTPFIVKSIEKTEKGYTKDKKGKIVYTNIKQSKQYLRFI